MIRQSRSLWLFVGAAVLLVVSLAIAGFSGYSSWQEDQSESARDQSVVVARRTAEGMFGYTYKTVDTQMAKVVDDMTSDFQKDWESVVKENIAPSAKEKELIVTATIQATGVMSASADKAEVMVFLNQKSVGKDPATGTYIQSRIKMGMEKKDGRWLVANVDPI